MRNAATVLGIIRERGRRGLPLEDVYRQLFNPALYLLAYGKIGRNAGALTQGATTETVDGMSLKRIQAIIVALRSERYRWAPVRRVYIEKRNSTKKRALGLPTWSDKLLQEVLRLILEAYYEPQFSSTSHGFRPNRGCGTALAEVVNTWTATTWFIEGDISACFDSLDHNVMLSILKESIHDNRFLRLIESLLKAGYLEEWRYHRTLSGSPQGGVVSPVLSNIYLDRLDTFVEHTLIPANTRGLKRKKNGPYNNLAYPIAQARQAGRKAEARALQQERQRLPSHDPQDPDYRRLRYVRYADDILLGFAGPRSEAEAIKRQLGEFLQDPLKLELSERKTLITHARTQAARFLGYEVHTLQCDSKRYAGRRSINGRIGLRVPHAVVTEKCARYMKAGKPMHRPERIFDTVFNIVAQYGSEYAGLVNYYRMAYNLSSLHKLRWVMGTSLAKTVAHKQRMTAAKVWRKYQRDHEGHRVFMVTVERSGKRPLVRMFPSTDLKWQPGVQLNDTPAPSWSSRTELVARLLADTCELCGSQEDVEVHHIRALKDINRPGRAAKPAWVEHMAARRRKTLVVCHACHMDITYGRPRRNANIARTTGEPCALKGASTVRRGADGKVPAAT